MLYGMLCMVTKSKFKKLCVLFLKRKMENQITDVLNQKLQDGRNFSDKWLNNIFEILMRVEEYERLAKNGCVNLIDYVQNPNLDFALIQEKNYQLFMTEVELLLNNIKHFINREDFLLLLLINIKVKKAEEDSGGFLATNIDSVSHRNNNVLKPEYYNIIPIMSELRGLIVKSLLTFINPKLKPKSEERL